ncbi:MAG: HEPN domain-containing protein [Ardenticatenia bacterium]|nr:HEPN domain-containing protein [Ardenticatenia bacterium]
MLRSAATALTPYAVTLRYPGDLPKLTEVEAQEALALARGVWDFVLKRLPTEVRVEDQS